MRFVVEYSPEAEDHLRALRARARAIILDSVEEQLTDRPDVETKDRKPMRPNPVAPWELRLGNLRVYYDIVQHPKRLVLVRAVGIKVHNSVWIGGEEVQL